jgi:hypothetical protein
VTFRFCDESAHGFGWVAEDTMQRCSHALLADGRVWVIDPVAWPEAEERIRLLGTPAAVVQLLDRHNRNCTEVADRLGVPHLRLPDALAPFEVVSVVNVRRWRERALWWPERRTLVVAEGVGTNSFYVSPGERLAVHPFLRLTPPRQLSRFDPDVILVGHGEGMTEGVAPELHRALRTARRGIPRWLLAHLRRGD